MEDEKPLVMQPAIDEKPLVKITSYPDIIDPSKTCAHCQQQLRGYASVGDKYLCHPEDGMDCYRLVTVYHHEMPCTYWCSAE